MFDLHVGNYLDDTKWSDLWAECLDKAMPFSPRRFAKFIVSFLCPIDQGI